MFLSRAAVSVESAIISAIDEHFRTSSDTKPISIAEKFTKTHRSQVQILRYLMQKGCASPLATHGLHAIEMGCFYTLIEALTLCQRWNAETQWPVDVFDASAATTVNHAATAAVPDATDFLAVGLSDGCRIFGDLLRRTRPTGQGKQVGQLLGYLDGLTGERKSDCWTPRLSDLCIAAVRRCLLPRGTAAVEDAVCQLPLPRGVKMQWLWWIWRSVFCWLKRKRDNLSLIRLITNSPTEQLNFWFSFKTKILIKKCISSCMDFTPWTAEFQSILLFSCAFSESLTIPTHYIM